MNSMRLTGLVLLAVLAGTTAPARTFSEDALKSLGLGATIAPYDLQETLSEEDRAKLKAAEADFRRAADLLEADLRDRASYVSILELVPRLRRYAPDQARVFWLHAIALAGTGELAGAHEASVAAAALPQQDTGILPALAQALLAHREGRPAEAEALLQEAVRQDPSHAYAFNLLGTVQAALGKPEAAATAFGTATRLAPETALFLRNAGLNELARGRASTAATAITAALALAPDDCQSLMALADVQSATQDLTAAETTLRHCLDQSGPARAEAAGALIEVLIRQNRFDDALIALDAQGAALADPMAVRLEILLRQSKPKAALDLLGPVAGTEPAAQRLRRALALAMAQDPAQSLMIVQSLRDSAPKDPNLAFFAAALLVATGAPLPADILTVTESAPDLKPAMEVFAALASTPAARAAARAAAADPILPGTRFTGVPLSDWEKLAAPRTRETVSLGLFWLLRGNDLAARAAFAPVPPDLHAVRYLDALAAVRLGDHEAARTALAATAQAVPGFFSAQVLMGELELRRQDLPAAFSHYRHATEAVEDGGALMRVALLGDSLNEVAVAEDALRRFIVLYPDSFIGYNQLAWLFIQREIRLEEALALAEQAHDLQPGNAGILDNIGWIRHLQGDSAAALPQLQEAARVSGQQNADILMHLAQVEAALGLRSEATTSARAFLGLATERHPHRAMMEDLLRSLN